MSRPIVNKRPGIAVDEIQESIRTQFPLQQNVNGWFLASYVGTEIKITASGTGGVEDLKNALKDNEVQYAYIRLPVIKDDTETVRDVYIQWTGPLVKTVEKARKKTSDAEYMKEVFVPHHAALEVIGKNNFNYKHLLYVSGPNSGTHVID